MAIYKNNRALTDEQHAKFDQLIEQGDLDIARVYLISASKKISLMSSDKKKHQAYLKE